MPTFLERCIQREKVERDDAQSYVGDLIIRQRLANEAVVKFAEELIPAGSRVIDACAGPEGSYLAATRRGYEWIGNDISLRFSDILHHTGAKVVLSDFGSAPFKSASVDATFFIFALNNICSPESAFGEAKRVTKPNGIIVEAEPGLSSGTGKIIYHSLLSDHPDLQMVDATRYENAGELVSPRFAGKPYTEQEYVDLLIGNALDLTRDAMYRRLRSIIYSEPKPKVFFEFQQYVIEQYFRHLHHVREKLGLEIEKAGVMVMGLVGQEWIIPDPIEVSPEQWVDEVLAVRRWKKKESSVVQRFPRTLDASSRRIVMPVLCLRNP